MNARRFLLVTAFAAAAFATVAALAAGARLGDDDDRDARMPRAAADLARVNFVNACGFSHRAPDDPIVFPGQPGKSHDHTFVGSRTTNAFSTLETLLASGSTCDRPGHTAAYWLPTLVADGSPVEPLGATIYYRRRTVEPVRAFPPGFRMIAGDALATTAQGRRVTFWSCGALADVPPSQTVPACPPGRRTGLRLHVTFPACWDGRTLDSADHRSHVAYQRRGVCPRSHPVELPQITVIYRFPQLRAGASVSLASGGQLSGHADFVNSWQRPALERLVESCLNALRHCGRGS